MDTLTSDDPAAIGALIATDPESARRRAVAAARRAAPGRRIELLGIAGEASVRLGAVADARALFASAADLALREGHESSAELLVRRAAMEAATGEGDLALRTLDEAEALLADHAHWRVWHQRGLVLDWSGRSEEAVELLRRARDGAELADEPAAVAKLLLNLAVARAHLGDTAGADADAAEAERRCRLLGDLSLAAQALHNRGWIAARAGDPAEAWRLMHDAASEPTWTAPPVVLADRAEVAHLAGLSAEAAELAESAWQAQLAAGDQHGAAATLLLRARIALDLGDPSGALELADELDGLLLAQGRLDLSGASAAVRLAAHRDACERAAPHESADRVSVALAQVETALGAVRDHAWRAERIEGLLAAGEIHLRAGNGGQAAELFERVVTDRHPDAHPDVEHHDVEHHIAAALGARARTGRLDRDRLELAWGELERRRRLPAPHELRGDRGAPTALLTRVALPPLLESGDGEEALRWLERLRSLPGPGGDPDLAPAGDALRALWARRQEARHRDETELDHDGSEPTDDETSLEAELVARARRSAEAEPSIAPTTIDEITGALGSAEIVWIVALNSGAWAVRCSARDTRVVPLDHHRLRSASQRLATAMRLGSEAWREIAGELDDVLGVVTGSGLVDLPDEVVLVPVGHAVEDLPFAALPSLTRRRIRICWSGTHWLRTRRTSTVRNVTIASTGVDNSREEVDVLGRIWPGSTTIEGADVTTDRVLAALATDDLVHIGAHGRLRRDNPMLSTLECADGPLYGYELVRTGRVAPTVLLWSCALGGARLPGDVGVTGWPVMLARLGCNAVIAAPGALPSEPAPDLAAEVHRGLARGEAADAVLARLRGVAVGELAARGAAMLAVHGAG